MINIKPTDRDLRLLIDAYNHSFLSFYQIKECHFKNLAQATVYNRLSKLINGELLESVRVNVKAIHKGGKDIGAIYFLTKNGFKLINKYHSEGIYRDAPVPINLNQLYHDLVLTDALKQLECAKTNCVGINSKLMSHQLKDAVQIPDGVIHIGDERYALEIELTTKSNSRYREIIYNYSTSSDFKKVLYLVKNDVTQNKIGDIIIGYSGQYKKTDDTGKFYFCTISEFFKAQRNFKFANGTKTFSATEDLKCNNRGFENEL